MIQWLRNRVSDSQNFHGFVIVVLDAGALPLSIMCCDRIFCVNAVYIPLFASFSWREENPCSSDHHPMQSLQLSAEAKVKGARRFAISVLVEGVNYAHTSMPLLWNDIIPPAQSTFCAGQNFVQRCVYREICAADGARNSCCI